MPEPVSGLFGEALNTTALGLSWQTPQKSVYNNLQLNLSSSVGDERIFNLSKDQSSLNVSGLVPGVEYTVQMIVVALRVHSTPTSGSFRTSKFKQDFLVFILCSGMWYQFFFSLSSPLCLMYLSLGLAGGVLILVLVAGYHLPPS